MKSSQITVKCWILFPVVLFTSSLVLSKESSVDDLMQLSLQELGEINIATGSPKAVFLAPAIASVITKEEIGAMGATTLDEILETVPGIHVSPSFSVGPLKSNYSIRGILTDNNPHVLVLINGTPLRGLWEGNRDDRFILPVSMISRVEVIRGPGSAIHGADAFAGTINVITKNGEEIDGAQTGVRVGSFDTYDAWFQFGKKMNNWDVFAGFETLLNKTDENRVIDSDLQTVFDGTFGTSASHAPQALNDDRKHYSYVFGAKNDNWTARFTGLKIWDAGVGVGQALALDPHSYHASNRYIGELLYANDDFHVDWDFNVNVTFSYLNEDNNFVLFPAGTTLPIGSNGNISFANFVGITNFSDGYIGNSDETNKISTIETIALYKGISKHKIRFSVGYQRQRYESTSTQNFGFGIIDGTQAVVDGSLVDLMGNKVKIIGPNKTRKIQYLSIQDEWSMSRYWELTAGIRFDNYSDFGKTTNPRAALVWQTHSKLTSKLLYGRAFRAPSIFELFSENNPVAQGNKDLDPEIIDTIEIALDFRPVAGLRFISNIFVYEIEGLIDYVDNDPTGASKTAQNASDQKGHGVEFEVSWRINNQLKIKGNSAWYKAVDKDTDVVVPNSPRTQVYGNIHWKFLPDYSLDTQWFWIGYRARAVDDTRSVIDDYHLANVTLSKKNILKHVDLSFAVRNIFDADIREPGSASIPNDYPMNGRSFWGEIKVRF